MQSTSGPTSNIRPRIEPQYVRVINYLIRSQCFFVYINVKIIVYLFMLIDGKIALVPENIRPIKEEEEEEIIINDGCSSLNGQVKAASVVMRRETAGGALGASVAFRAACRGISTKEQIIIKAPIVESLSVEIVEACVGQDDKRRQDALQSLEVDTGIQAILPRLSRMIHYAIRCNVVHHQKSSYPMIYGTLHPLVELSNLKEKLNTCFLLFPEE
uniref:ARM repeat superfamily protein n=1 Tax=Heterorhabditis bacteriophora TaxID=37862 RepID=A0A1I7XF49_HETBA